MTDAAETGPIRPAVADAWRAWNAPLEGVVAWMYLDTLGLVTTGMGNLIDPLVRAIDLPWIHPDGSPASPDEISAEWAMVKATPRLAAEGAAAAERVTALRLPEGAIDALDRSALEEDAAELLRIPEFGGFPAWPADAQMGILSMAWAMGADFAAAGRWPHFRAACAAGDFRSAAAQSTMQDAGGGIDRRNVATAAAFAAAADTLAQGRDLGTLWGPRPV